MKDKEIEYQQLALEQARLCKPEDGTDKPKVGAVLVRDGEVLGKAYRGEPPYSKGAHAEYILLDHKLKDDPRVVGATLYTTLEPCTKRGNDKTPCKDRVVSRQLARVVIGMLDPNKDIQGNGVRALSDAGCEVALFEDAPHREVKDMNREFIRAQDKRSTQITPDQSDADIIENITGGAGGHGGEDSDAGHGGSVEIEGSRERKSIIKNIQGGRGGDAGHGGRAGDGGSVKIQGTRGGPGENGGDLKITPEGIILEPPRRK